MLKVKFLIYNSVILRLTHVFYNHYILAYYFRTLLFSLSTFLALAVSPFPSGVRIYVGVFTLEEFWRRCYRQLLGLIQRDRIISGGKATPSGLQPSRSLN